MLEPTLPDIRPNPKTDPYTEDERVVCAKAHARLRALLSWCERVMTDSARYGVVTATGEHLDGGFSYGGESVNGKQIGALHVYNQRAVYQQVPNAEVVADYLADMPAEERFAAFQYLLERMRTDWYMTAVRNKWPDAIKACEHAEEQLEGAGFLTQHGEASIEVRANEPNGETNEVVELDDE